MSTVTKLLQVQVDAMAAQARAAAMQNLPAVCNYTGKRCNLQSKKRFKPSDIEELLGLEFHRLRYSRADGHENPATGKKSFS